MAEIVFSRRRGRANFGRQAHGDILVSRCVRAGSQVGLAVRIHKSILEKLSWLVGDHVVLEVKGNEWKLRRVSGKDEGGIMVSPLNRNSGHGVARFAASKQSLDGLFSGEKSFEAWLATGEGLEATFVRG